MSKGESLNSGVLRKIERLVCDCVNEAFAALEIDKYEPVSADAIYEGVTNIPLIRRMARSAVFIVAHDRFGVSYNELKGCSGICQSSIMRSVRKYKDAPESDDVVRKINEFIEVELKKFPIL